MSDLPVISATKLKTYASCPRKFYYQYVVREPTVRHPAASMGTAVHKAVERVYTTGEEPLGTYNATWAAEFQQFPELVTDPRTYKAQSEGMKIITSYDFEQRVPTASEVDFDIEFPDPFDPICRVRGFIDQVYLDTGTLVDLKTSRNKPIPEVLAYDPQFVLYSWAYLNLYNESPAHVLWHHLRTKEDIRANSTGIQQFNHTLSIVTLLLKTLAELDKLDDEDPNKKDVFLRSIGEPCLFCNFRTQCLGV